MSNFKQAIKWLEEGKEIRRKIWEDPKYKTGLMKGATVNGNVEPHFMHLYCLNDFLADDWEICKEEK
ncbi:hypothetical protein LCGC14_1406320 [marine sediment metagenome]|uniref:Thoeris anti-defense 2-like domain-containing protein n=1 Tax=marine sediment metagenome TaxID=412755 RepID=A0A0F9KGJ2_9ZZZZ